MCGSAFCKKYHEAFYHTTIRWNERKTAFRARSAYGRFRGDYHGSQFWVTETIPADQVKPVNLDTGGGLFTLRVERAPGVPLTDTPVYVFSPSGSYLGITAQTNAQGVCWGTFLTKWTFWGIVWSW